MATNADSDNADSDGLTPHPLIRGLATRLVGDADIAGARSIARDSSLADATLEATQKFASEAQLPELAMFSGYLGGTVTDPEGTEWRLLYKDAKALTWLLVPGKKIVLHDRVEDKSAAFRERDVIWVRTDTPVRQGLGPESDQARFLVGTFTSAGDLHASLTDASALSPASGILCAPTPECCMRHSR